MKENLIPIEWNKQKIMTTKTLAECYGASEKNINDNFSNNKERFEEGKHYYLLKGEELKKFKNLPTVSGLVNKFTPILMLWTFDGCIIHSDIVSDSRKHIDKILKYFNYDGLYIKQTIRKELEFLDKLEHSLIPFGLRGINQYTIFNYRIDYYIPNLNIAIEYDENDHKNYSYEAHEGRQKEIEKELGCRFIRVSDKNSDEYNIGLVIKEIFNI